MNWGMLAALDQFAAVVVGIPFLIYLALQTRERRHSAVNTLTVQWGDLTQAVHEGSEFTALFLRAVQSFDDLDSVSQIRFSAFENRFLKNFEAPRFLRREGILSTALWDATGQAMSDFLACEGVRQWWQTRKHWHMREFTQVVEKIIARGDKPNAYSIDGLSELAWPGTSSAQ
jgi:hypothetical protein